MASLKYWLWLANLPGVGNIVKLALLDRFEEPDAVFYADREAYLHTEGITQEIADALENKSLDRANEVLGECDRLGIRIITIRDSGYPARLRNIYDPPLLLYVQGRMPLFDEEVAVTMVGTRGASLYAQQAAERLAFQLAGLGAIVVSGLAKGGDAAAHRGALRSGGLTAAVIAGGHDVIYPAENGQLYADIAARGVIVSEYPPGTNHSGRHFPVRNRILSGLSLATVVIEAPARSGALITADRALDQGRDVFAIPGHLWDENCAGSNRLLRDGAGVITDVWDILRHYADQYPGRIRTAHGKEPTRYGGEEPPPKPEKKAKEKEKAPELPVLDLGKDNGLTDDQMNILRALSGRTMQVDDIIDETQIPARRVLSALTVLEIDGHVAQSAGKRFALAVTLIGG